MKTSICVTGAAECHLLRSLYRWTSNMSPLSPPPIQTPTTPTSPFRAHAPLLEKPPTPRNRVREESRKLLAHVLQQLKTRPLPASVYEAFASVREDASTSSFAAIAQTVRGAVKLRGGRLESDASSVVNASGVEEDDEQAVVYTTDATVELLTQLRDVLVISAAQGWAIFEERGSVPETRSNVRSPFRLSRNRNSLQPAGRRSRSSSPSNHASSPELLSQCISILSSIILEDCRFQIHAPRPSRPPNSLQTLVLDVAQFLLHSHRHDPKIVSEIGLALIPAFNTFPTTMHARLLAFFEDGLLRSLLSDLAHERGPPLQRASSGPESDAIPGAISITVAPAMDEGDQEPKGPFGWVPWKSSDAMNLRSVTAPFQSQAIYCLSALLPPLLAALLESVDVISSGEPRVDVVHRFYRLVDLLVSAKPDIYLDILEVAAYHPSARRSALSLISTFWPHALGHFIVAKSLPSTTYIDAVLGGKRDMRMARDYPYTHHFVPWHFHSLHDPISTGLTHAACHSCSTDIDGFGLLCPHCMCCVHFGCYDYPEGSAVVQYSPDQNVQRVASFRFCPLPLDRSSRPQAINGHHFNEVNIFTLCLCFICRQPLWGCKKQGFGCVACSQFAHGSCIATKEYPICYGSSNVIDSRTMTIQWAELRQSCNDYYSDILSLTAEQLATRSYEEIAVISAVVWTELQLMTNGVSSGSIEILHKGRSAAHSKGFQVKEFELHRVLGWCSDLLLRSSTIRVSMAFTDYLEQTRQPRSAHGLVYHWGTLVFVASTIKSPYPLPVPQANFLNVVESTMEDDAHVLQPFEVVTLAHLRNILGYEFTIHSDTVARYLLEHFFMLGFFEMTGKNLDKDAVCTFPIPLGLDLTTNVETLVAAVEACLSDLDLSVNEAGFLLILRKFWPSGMATDYSLKRLARIVITWVLAEDDNLAIILRDYLGKNRTLPGVRPASEPLPWPLPQLPRAAPGNAGNTGGEYVLCRRALQNRYVVKWLSELHAQDPALYTSSVYDICVELSQDAASNLMSCPNSQTEATQTADRVLKSITRICQIRGTPTSAFDAWFLRWLNDVSNVQIFTQNMTSLYKLLPRDTDPSQRFSSAVDISSAASEGAVGAPPDPWKVVARIAERSKDDFTRSLHWLLAFSRSGIDVPITVFEKFSILSKQFGGSLIDAIHLVDAILATSWLRVTNRDRLQTIIAALHSAQLAHSIDCLTMKIDVSSVLSFIRKSLGACLLLFGSDRDKIIELELIQQHDIEGLPSRRKIVGRAAHAPDPVVVHPALLAALEAYITTGTNHDVTTIAAKFLDAFLNHSPFLESHEVDNFVLRNTRMLTQCAWQFYDIQRHEISSIRTTFLLRVVLVDSQPFQELLHDWMLPTAQWELRLLAVSRLFRIILDVTSPAFNVEGRQWRSSIIDVFYRFFFALWTDEKEEIRVVVDTFASGLLPAHFEAISLCWMDSLTMPIAERVKLVSFLIQLRPHYPQWQVLSWDAIIDALAEEEDDPNKTATGVVSAHLSLYGLSSSRDEIGVQSSNTDPDTGILRGSLLLLGLQMIADGIPIDLFALQKLKVSLVRALGFADVVATPSANGDIQVQFGDAQAVPDASLPCLNELLSVLDSSHVITSNSLLVGSALVDIPFNLFCTGELHLLPILTLKALLESLAVCIYKHNFDHPNMKALQPTLRRVILRALDLMLDDVSYEIRQLALSATQAFVKRWPAYIGTLLYTSVERVSKLIVSQSHNSQDALVAQARSFMEYSVIQYENTGFIFNLLKRRLDRNVFIVLKEITDVKARLAPGAESLRDVLLRGLLSRGMDNDHSSMDNFLGNLQTFVELVYHQGYSAELMNLAGQQLLAITRRTIDIGEGAALDPTPLLLIPALLIQHNKTNSREVLVCSDTILRSLLLRMNVEASCISRLLHVIMSMQRKTHNGETSPIVATIFEILTDALRLKNRTPPGTVRALIEVISEPLDHTGNVSLGNTHPNDLQTIVDNGFFYLQNHVWADTRSENDFTASLAIGKLVLQAATTNSSLYSRMAEPTDRPGKPGLSVRSWNLIVLAVLLEKSDRHIQHMFDIFPTLSNLHHNVLRPYSQSSAGLDTATADINHAYIAIKLWLLLAQRKAASEDATPATAFMVWNELWPPLEGMVGALEYDLHLGMSTTVASLTWSTIADLFIFLRALRCPIALETPTQLAILNRLRSHGGQDSAMSKVTRTLKTLSEPPGNADAVELDILIQQAGKELVATEKMRVLSGRV
ncbi:hypothetical protein MKEN_01206100 [Mycena kentingensis (nom. inval.)]|nr:hypothetical protein MKEN_01206100 [Mycena kentingensis (nom. inval.)]